MAVLVQGLLPATVRLAVGNRQGWSTVPAEAVQPGALLVVLPGDRLPVDGVVVEGTSTLDESALTGEPLPITRGPGQHLEPPASSASPACLGGNLAIMLSLPWFHITVKACDCKVCDTEWGLCRQLGSGWRGELRGADNDSGGPMRWCDGSGGHSARGGGGPGTGRARAAPG